jgi:hypothetical protein
VRSGKESFENMHTRIALERVPCAMADRVPCRVRRWIARE